MIHGREQLEGYAHDDLLAAVCDGAPQRIRYLLWRLRARVWSGLGKEQGVCQNATSSSVRAPGRRAPGGKGF